ncbi:DUF742 domain-containing protein [Streptomyces albidus (ex Kaewkla and Franco 2022)]|uniref:DUF742 domain-containing protein n=1 Tax=Streptomyces albidus (ex Kaewkla and Franco 2022) TaxID=722709 RepID=UPI0015EE5A42|nr:DUF742 domain-containing protein [Streptomyces albidus (ex Kaewkla and Franco 2022)]
MTDFPRQWFDDGSGRPVPPSPPPSTPPSTPEWFDDEAGPLVRLYAMTAGRARPTSEAFDLIAVVEAGEADEGAPPDRSPEHAAILALCRASPSSVADIAADSDLPVGVVRVLLGDLLDDGLIRVSRPVEPAQLPDEHILREVIDGLRAL